MRVDVCHVPSTVRFRCDDNNCDKITKSVTARLRIPRPRAQPVRELRDLPVRLGDRWLFSRVWSVLTMRVGVCGVALLVVVLGSGCGGSGPAAGTARNGGAGPPGAGAGRH